jgi:hypothetical protein
MKTQEKLKITILKKKKHNKDFISSPMHEFREFSVVTESEVGSQCF